MKKKQTMTMTPTEAVLRKSNSRAWLAGFGAGYREGYAEGIRQGRARERARLRKLLGDGSAITVVRDLERKVRAK